ncbi:MAG: insulinase family protein [Colwellia sp.]
MIHKNIVSTYLKLTLLASLLLTGCTQSEPENSQTVEKNQTKLVVSTQPEKKSAIVKSPNDKRSYHSIILANQLEVILVSDPTIEKSAAALSVGVGSFQEDKNFGGLAHYLEHMLFLGTKSYPTVGEYSEFISRNGGAQNAYTELDHTNYMVAVNNDAFDEALKRFSGFFYESLLDATYAEKERNAVHSEWTMKGPNDYVILGQLDGKTLNQNHPISQFNWGNLESLSDKENRTLHTELIEFYNKYYSANIMKATMISNLPLADMKKLAQKHFGKIENKNIEKPTINVPVAKTGQLKKIVRYLPQTEMKQLQVKFVINNNADSFAVKPNRFISYLISNEMPNTLAPTLREMGLTSSLHASANPSSYGNAGDFSIYATLTEKGLKHRDTVVGYIFNYLNLIKEQGVDEKYFTEIKQSLNNEFRFKEKINDYSYAMSIAANMQSIPTNYVLSSRYEYQHFNAKAINDVLDQLTLDNARIIYIDKNQVTDTDMHFFKGKYKVEAIDAKMEAQWQAIAKDVSLYLPTPNTLMPESFELVKSVHTEKPVELIKENGLSLHLAHSKHFSQPKGTFIANFNSGYDKKSPRHTVLSTLLSRGLNLSLTTLDTEASTAGMGLGVGSYNGLVLTANGFTDKQSILLEKAYKHILAYKMSDGELENLKAAFISEMKSKNKKILISQLFGQFSKVISLDQFSDESLLAEINSITTAEISTFRDELLKFAKMNIFAFGNYTDQKAIQMAKFLEGLLPKDRAISAIYFSKNLQPKVGSIINWQKDSDMTDIAFTEVFFRPFDVKKHAAAKMLSRILRPALFKQLRTEEQLAYTVGFFNQALRDQLAMGFYIQSPAKGLGAISDRINDFKANFTEKLLATTSEELETIRKSEIIGLTQPPKNLREEASPFSSDWREQKLNFDTKEKLISAINTVKMADITQLYKELVAGDDFGRIVLQMRGSNFKEEPYADFKDAVQLKDVNAFHLKQSNK